MKVQPYLCFNGRCEEAAEFYRGALGAEVVGMMRMKDSPEPHPGGLPPGSENKIMHMALQIGDSQVLATDGRCMGASDCDFKGFSLSYSVSSEAEADKVFARLADGGRIEMPLGKTFFSPRFGMVADRFGVSWAVVTMT